VFNILKEEEMKIHGKEYTEVKDRLKLLYGEIDKMYPNAYIVTTCHWHSETMDAVLFKAEIYPNTDVNDRRVFTGWAFEERDFLIISIKASQYFNRVRSDPRFKTILKK
jgi:hypothetical protein